MTDQGTSSSELGVNLTPYAQRQESERHFDGLVRAMQKALDMGDSRHGDKLFSVPTAGLWETFLDAFEDPVVRQSYNCHCCRTFIGRYGGLVRVGAEGEVLSALWEESFCKDELAPYAQVVGALRREVERRQVERRFLWREPVLGVAEAGGYHHFCVLANPPRFDATKTSGQMMAALRQERITLGKAVVEMPAETVRRAVAMLEAGELAGAEAMLPMGRFFRDVQERAAALEGKARNNFLWLAVGTAARGWCMPKGSAFGALVDDLESGRPIERVVAANRARIAPNRYQRPQAAPSEGNLKQAELVVEQLGLASALRRRPMALEECRSFWVPKERPKVEPAGVFGHLRPGAVKTVPAETRLTGKAQPMTFAKFERDVLPRAYALRARAPGFGAYAALTTATVADSAPLFMWDEAERRNSGAWYLHVRGSHASSWGLVSGRLTAVLALAKLPPDWYDEGRYRHVTHGRVLFVLEGCADASDHSGLGLFPSCLRGELHAVRATIEAHSNKGQLDEEKRQRASGWLLQDGYPIELEVELGEGVASYLIDRLE